MQGRAKSAASRALGGHSRLLNLDPNDSVDTRFLVDLRQQLKTGPAALEVLKKFALSQTCLARLRPFLLLK